MGKFYGKIGFVKTEEKASGVYEEVATEKNCYGEVQRNIMRWQGVTDHVNDNVSLDVQISILGDPYTFKNFSYIRFIEWMGTPWKVNSVEPQFPRLILSIGGVYNGVREQEAGATSDS